MSTQENGAEVLARLLQAITQERNELRQRVADLIAGPIVGRGDGLPLDGITSAKAVSIESFFRDEVKRVDTANRVLSAENIDLKRALENVKEERRHLRRELDALEVRYAKLAVEKVWYVRLILWAKSWKIEKRTNEEN